MDARQRFRYLLLEAMPGIRRKTLSRLVTLASETTDKSSPQKILKIAVDQLARELDHHHSEIESELERNGIELSKLQRKQIELNRTNEGHEIHIAAIALAKERNIDLAEAEKRVRQSRSSKIQNLKGIRRPLIRKLKSDIERITQLRKEVIRLQNMWPLKKLTYECPKCKKFIERDVLVVSVSNKLKVDLMKYHWREFHKMDWKRASEWMDNHRHKTDSTNYVSELLSFEILPPGEWTLERTIQQYRRNENAIVEKWGCSIDYSRIREIYKLEPDQRYWGTEGFLGYSIYEFSRFEKVVLDCPIEGNAVYLLYKDRWKNQSGLTKKEIRDNLRGEYRKIVHKGQWIDRVLDELKRGSFM